MQLQRLFLAIRILTGKKNILAKELAAHRSSSASDALPMAIALSVNG